MTSRLLIFVLLAFGLFSGVRSKVEHKGPPQPAHKGDCQIEFLDNKGTDRPHDVVGTIHVYVRRNKITMGREGTYEEAVPEFRKQACKLGADAVIVLQQTISHDGEFKLLYVKGDAIGYTPKPTN